LNGLRVSEACAADVVDLGVERAHRVLALDPHDAARILTRLARRAELAKHITPHSLRHTMVTLALDAGVSLRDVQDAARPADPRTTRRYDRARHAFDRHATYTLTAFIAEVLPSPIGDVD
jgi:integrase